LPTEDHTDPSDMADEPEGGPRDASASTGVDATENAYLAAATAMMYLMEQEAMEYLALEKASVYGAAVAIPQVARSSGWPTTLTGLAIRSYIFLAFNLFIQFFLLSVINEELRIMYAYAGQMHLCDFGASIEKCPDGPNCKGPDGTTYDPTRLYEYETWATRKFVRDSLLQLFPQLHEQIKTAADPGEYGLEDYYCRLVCCLLFMMAIIDDLKATIALLFLLIQLPTASECWISYEVPNWDTKERVMNMNGWSELDLVKFKVAGMPMCWKIANIVFVFLPKAFIWWSLSSSGFHFLMETAGIVDLVVNCMALTFILSIDEMCFERLATQASKYIMSNLKDIELRDLQPAAHPSERSLLTKYHNEELTGSRKKIWKVVMFVLPKRLLFVGLLMALFVGKYYYFNCIRLDDGSWVSKPMHLPDEVVYNPLSFMYDALLDWRHKALWHFETSADEDS